MCHYRQVLESSKSSKIVLKIRSFLHNTCNVPKEAVNITFLHCWTSFLLFVFLCFIYESNMRLELLVKRNKHVAVPAAHSFTVQHCARRPLYEHIYICFLLAPDINYIPLELSTKCAAGVIDRNIKRCIQYPLFLLCSFFVVFLQKFTSFVVLISCKQLQIGYHPFEMYIYININSGRQRDVTHWFADHCFEPLSLAFCP